MCHRVPGTGGDGTAAMRARRHRDRDGECIARGCVREKNLENSCAFRNASSFARSRAPRRPRRRRRVDAVFRRARGRKKSLWRAPDFASQHPICAESRVVPARFAGYRGRARETLGDVPDVARGNETGRLRGRIGVLREAVRDVSAPLPRAVRRSRRGRGVRSTARVPRPPPRTASRRRRRPR